MSCARGSRSKRAIPSTRSALPRAPKPGLPSLATIASRPTRCASPPPPPTPVATSRCPTRHTARPSRSLLRSRTTPTSQRSPRSMRRSFVRAAISSRPSHTWSSRAIPPLPAPRPDHDKRSSVARSDTAHVDLIHPTGGRRPHRSSLSLKHPSDEKHKSKEEERGDIAADNPKLGEYWADVGCRVEADGEQISANSGASTAPKADGDDAGQSAMDEDGG